MTSNFNDLITYGKSFSGLTPELEQCLREIAPQMTPHLPMVTDSFYAHLVTIPRAAKFVEGRVDKLKQTHLTWLNGLFNSHIDAEFAKNMHHVGDVHVKVQLPAEFMAGAMTLITNELTHIVIEEFGHDLEKCSQALRAVGAITGLALMIMQDSYQKSTLVEELDKFLHISGMSRTLFANLAKAYKK